MLRDIFKLKRSVTKISNEKIYESKNLTGKGQYTIKVVDQSLIKQAQRLIYKRNKITIVKWYIK